MTQNVLTKIVFTTLLLSSLALGADLDTILQKIFTFTQSTTSKSVVALIFIGLAIYIWKNLERWKEWGLNVAGIIIGLVLYLNAQTVAGWFF